MTASLLDRLKAALPVAMKARDAPATAALRAALGAIANAEAVGGDIPKAGAIEDSARGAGATDVARRVLTDADVETVVRAEIDERLDAAAGYDVAAPDAAARLRAEAGVLRRHLEPARPQ